MIGIISNKCSEQFFGQCVSQTYRDWNKISEYLRNLGTETEIGIF